MKRLMLWILILMLLGGNALAALETNSFFDDAANAGGFASFAWDGEYFYWLHGKNDSLSWEEIPVNLYRMKPGQMEAELILQGREDFWIWDVYSIGDRLLLSVSDEINGETHPAVVKMDGSSLKLLDGNIGSVVLEGGRIYNSADGAIYEININKLKPKKIYEYPAHIAGDHPILIQKIGMNLYFTTDSFDWYNLDLQTGMLNQICTLRGDGFVKDYKLYISDYDNGGTYCYDMSGARTKISDHRYVFLQGSGDYVRAQLVDPAGLGSAAGGRIFDMTWITDRLEDALIGTCDPMYDCLLGGRLAHYDADQNRMSWSSEPVTERIQ